MKRTLLVLIAFAALALGIGCNSETITNDVAPPAPNASASVEPAGQAQTQGDVIPWGRADQHVGEVITIEGPVIGAFYADTSTGEPTFLNVGKDYPEPGRFAVVIWGDDRAAFPGAPEAIYAGRTIRVTGEVYAYEDAYQMEVASPSAIEVMN